ncbi:MAG: hypothetical protein WC651_04675 [Candidatus Gracilibacteria bacterium]|jgi:hypothetical protein
MAQVDEGKGDEAERLDTPIPNVSVGDDEVDAVRDVQNVNVGGVLGGLVDPDLFLRKFFGLPPSATEEQVLEARLKRRGEALRRLFGIPLGTTDEDVIAELRQDDARGLELRNILGLPEDSSDRKIIRKLLDWEREDNPNSVPYKAKLRKFFGLPSNANIRSMQNRVRGYYWDRVKKLLGVPEYASFEGMEDEAKKQNGDRIRRWLGLSSDVTEAQVFEKLKRRPNSYGSDIKDEIEKVSAEVVRGGADIEVQIHGIILRVLEYLFNTGSFSEFDIWQAIREEGIREGANVIRTYIIPDMPLRPSSEDFFRASLEDTVRTFGKPEDMVVTPFFRK